jgi:hypothetical protein
MRTRIVALLMLVAMVATSVLWPQSSSAANSPQEVPPSFPPSRVRYFKETGHSTVNSFQEFWNRTPNALFVIGYPISQPFIEESFTEPGKFYRVQYFERAVLEEHPENQGTNYYVLGRLLGNKIIQGRENEAPFQPVADPGDGTYDSATRHTLRNSPAPFRNFYNSNGGIEVFGRPTSEQFQEVNQATGETYWVQYFERQRMEWHPEEPNPQYRIMLGLLGNEYRDANHKGNRAFNPVNPQDALPQPFIYGYNALLYGQGTEWQDRNRALTLIKNSGVNWVRQQVRWQDLHDRSGAIYWGELDQIVADSHAAGVNLLFSVVRAPSWATPDGNNGLPSRQHIGTFADFMGQMAARYKGRVQAYEVWNEPNLAYENGGTVANANLYMDVLVAASQAIKANDPYAIVVSAGPSSTETNHTRIALSDMTFFRQMFADPRFRKAVDVVGVHPGGHANPPQTMWPGNPSSAPGWTTSSEFYFRRVENVRALMEQAGLGDLQMWITEFGWATANNTPGYEFGNYNSEQDQARYIVDAFQMGRNDYAPWVGAMFLWQFNFAVEWKYKGNEQHEQAAFGVINGDWSPRPSYHAIQNMPKR